MYHVADTNAWPLGVGESRRIHWGMSVGCVSVGVNEKKTKSLFFKKRSRGEEHKKKHTHTLEREKAKKRINAKSERKKGKAYVAAENQ